MSTMRSIFSAAIGVAAVVAASPAQEETGGFGVAKTTQLSTIRHTPLAFKNVWVQFKCHYLGLGSVHNPFFTRFTRADYVNFAVWADDQKIWERKQFDDACSTLFIEKKQSGLLTKVYSLKRYDRCLVTGVVRNAWQGEPWIEITSIEPIDGRLTTASLRHMARGYQYIEQSKWQQASIEFNLAASSQMTDFARGWLNGYQGLCMMRLGRVGDANHFLSAANGILPREQVITDWMASLAKDPRAAVDGRVQSQVRKGERPMWEAVEDKKAAPGKKPAKPAPSSKPDASKPQPKPGK